MTAASPTVLLLLGLAVLVGVLMVLAAVGKLPLGMDIPPEPWWTVWRRRRREREYEREIEVAAAAVHTDPDHPEPMGPARRALEQDRRVVHHLEQRRAEAPE
jgi:hypothetical protein